MPNHSALAWSVAALFFVTAAGLGGALYRTHATVEKQEKTIRYLRDQQSKIHVNSDKEAEALTEKISAAQQELLAAQNAQRALTEQLFAAEADIDSLLEELETLEQTQTQPTENISPAYPAFTALRRTVLQGIDYSDAWEAVQKALPNIPADIGETLKAHKTGISASSQLRRELAVLVQSKRETPKEDSILARLSDVISIRKIDENDAALRKAMASGNLARIAAMVRDDPHYAEWLAAYDARQATLKALLALESFLAGQHG